VVCLAFTDFNFNEIFFFRPLLIVMMVTYFIGCYSLPAFLTYLDFDVCRLGKESPEASVYLTKSLALHASNKSSSEDSSDEAHKEAPESLEKVESEDAPDEKS
jgi:hypothetical protein